MTNLVQTIWRRSIVFSVLAACLHASTPQAFALESFEAASGSNLVTTARIYDAMDALAGDEPNRYAQAVSILQIARNFTRTKATANYIEDAIKALSSTSPTNNRHFPNAVRTREAVTSLRAALQTNRVRLNQSSASESLLLEKLILTHLMPSQASEVKIQFEGISREDALTNLAAYLMDSRAAQYDPDVALLVNQRPLEGEPYAYEQYYPDMTFILPTQTFSAAGSSMSTAQLRDLAEELSSIGTEMIAESGAPMKINVRAKGSDLELWIEVKGFQYLPMVEDLLQNSLSLANGNRYLWGIANGIESLAAFASAQEMGNNPSARAFMEKLAARLGTVEDAFRLKVLENRWSRPTVETVRTMVNRSHEMYVARLERNLARTLDRMRAQNSALAEMEAAQAKTARWIEGAKVRHALTLKEIDGAVKALESDAKFNKLDYVKKSFARFRAAESAAASALSKMSIVRSGMAALSGGRWAITANRLLATVSISTAAYYAFKAKMDLSRTTDPGTRRQIKEVYGVKMANALIYLVPAVGELAALLDVGGWVIETTVFKLAGYDGTLPRTESVLRKGLEWVENLGFRMGGMTRFKVDLVETQEALGIVPFYGKTASGQYSGRTLVEARRSLLNARQTATEDARVQAVAALQKLEDQLATSSRKFVALVLWLNDLTGSRYNSELGDFHDQLMKELFDRQNGYYSSAQGLLLTQ